MNAFTLLGAAGLAALSALGAPSVDESPSTLPTADETGTISGKVVWEGDRPDAKPALSIKASETEGCKHGGSGVATEDRTLLISSDGGVANVVMMISATDVKVPDAPIVLDQKGCRFEPRVLIVPVGGTLRFANSDDTNHNVHTFAKKNQPLNKNVAGGSDLDQELTKAEVINVVCDVHTWMKCFVVVSDASHNAVSAADGSFKLEGLPPGDYKIAWWHEELGKGKTEAVTVEAGKTTEFIHKVGATKKKKGGRGRRR